MLHRRSLRWLALFAAIGLLAACASRTPPAEEVYPAPAPSGSAATTTLRAPAPAAAAPRLGTQWGEGVESRVQTVQARRLTPDQPDEVASIGYNDAAGVRQSAGANPERRLNLQLAQGDVEWAVLDENDRPLPLQRGRRSDDMFRIAGTEGARYTLVFRNLSERSYEVVTTVDGLDVLSGQPGSLRNSGYVLRPQATLRIEGFRKSESEVAAFRFSAPGRAYAANTPAGDKRNIGVIGTALFELELPGVKRPPRRPAPGAPNPFPADSGSGSPYAPPPRYAK